MEQIKRIDENTLEVDGKRFVAEKPIKPPLGLMPLEIAILQRKREVIRACSRYSEVGKPIPKEWIDELKVLAGVTE